MKKLSDYEMKISFNLRLSYKEMLKCRNFIESLGGYSDFYPGGSSYYGTKEIIIKLISFMEENNIDIESLEINKDADEATKEKIKRIKRKYEK